jgi:hypothetical protein
MTCCEDCHAALREIKEVVEDLEVINPIGACLAVKKLLSRHFLAHGEELSVAVEAVPRA